MITFVPLPLKYDPLTTEAANAFKAACAVICPEPPKLIGIGFAEVYEPFQAVPVDAAIPAAG